jgi:putative acetyltransferase
MTIAINQRSHLQDFVRLNEQWILEHFSLEAPDRALAQHPEKILDDGGFVFSLLQADEVIGVCALFKGAIDSSIYGDQAARASRYQLARMAVRPDFRGRGLSNLLIQQALDTAKAQGANNVYLLTNTKLVAAVRLYQKFGFSVTQRGQHPIYARCNLVMAREI